MHTLLCVLLAAAAVLADDSQERRSKLPYIADAVGNSLPAPSMVPATVGSPVNLLTPDRYEFYTFDESGELVKRLMTLEEIQAIVAAGEETEGLVTFANDNQPTIAFNFSQPSYTKVHNVVTNVQNVLKAQMEAQKNRTNITPTLDTPDVSDSWSQILPSIFGNTGGVDIVPDRTSESFITPETETIEFENTNESSQSKDNELVPDKILTNDIPVKIESTTVATTTTTKPTTTRKITTSTTKKPTVKTTTTAKPTSTTPKSVKSSTVKLTSTTTTKPRTTVRSTTTTKTKATSTTAKPNNSSTNKYKSTTKLNVKTSASTKDNSNKINESTKVTPQYEKFNTFIPTMVPTLSTAKNTEKPNTSTKLNIVSSTPASKLQLPSSTEKQINDNETKFSAPGENKDEINVTTPNSQPISPSTTIVSTENAIQKDTIKQDNTNQDDDTNNEPALPLFDVAQSISQIASDLGNYAPLPTSEDSLETNKENELNIESKENLEFDIPTDLEQENITKSDNNISNNMNFENYVKITTLDPQKNEKVKESNHVDISNKINSKITPTEESVLSTTVSSYNTIDPILSNSMGDMLFQIINENPDSNIIDKNSVDDEQLSTTQVSFETTTSLEETLSTVTETADDDTTFAPETTTSIILLNESNDKKTKKTEDMEKISLKTHIPNAIPKEKVKFQTPDKNNTFFEAVNELNISTEKEINKSTISSQNLNKTSNDLLLITSSTTSPTITAEKNIKDKIEDSNVKNESTSPEVKKSSLIKNIDQDNNLNKLKTNIQLPKIDEIKKKFQKVNIDDKEMATDRNSWKLIPTVPPPRLQESEKIKQKIDKHSSDSSPDKDIILDFSNENQGLEVTTKDLGEDVVQFTELCNELAFKYWQEIIPNIDNKRSFVLSPFSVTSMLAMMFMGARGATSGEMNEILKLDDMVTFNPHFTLKNISDSIETSSNSGVAVSAFIRELYSERSKGKLLTFYKERAQHFYNGHVEEVNFKLISDIIRRRTNLLVKRYTWGKIPEYIKSNYISMHPPLAAFSTNIFETDCTGSSVDGRDGEMYFVVSPNVRQRRLVPVPAVVYKNNFMAGYDPVLDATAAALGNTNSVISTLFLMPGQQGNVVNAEDLESLEKRFLDSKPVSTWNRLLRTLLPRIGLELQIPRFSHKSMLNVSAPLKKMGLKELFDSEHANLAGLNGPSKDIYLSDMLQLTTFVTCGEGSIGEQHHIEEYPEISQQKRRSSRWATIWDEPRDYQRAFHDPHDLGDAMHLPLHLRPRQARLPSRNAQPARRLKFDRPFLYFVRHNPTGMILYVGRYNPRLLP